MVLKYVARHPGCTNADIVAHVREVSPSTAEQAGWHLKILSDRYRMVERRLPVFAKPDFLTAHRRYRGWRLERVAIAPKIDHAMRVSLEALGAIPQDLTDLVQGL